MNSFDDEPRKIFNLSVLAGASCGPDPIPGHEKLPGSNFLRKVEDYFGRGKLLTA